MYIYIYIYIYIRVCVCVCVYVNRIGWNEMTTRDLFKPIVIKMYEIFNIIVVLR